MSGFRTEKQLWKWMKPRMKGTWRRVEAITPEGFPDVVGTHDGAIFFVELKVLSDVRSSQKKFLAWLQSGGCRVFIARGSDENKTVMFMDLDGRIVCPVFWYT